MLIILNAFICLNITFIIRYAVEKHVFSLLPSSVINKANTHFSIQTRTTLPKTAAGIPPRGKQEQFVKPLIQLPAVVVTEENEQQKTAFRMHTVNRQQVNMVSLHCSESLNYSWTPPESSVSSIRQQLSQRTNPYTVYPVKMTQQF